MNQYLSIALSSNVIRTSAKVSLCVGTVLALINHYPAIASGSVDLNSAVRILVTYLVPYLVSTYSAVSAVINTKQAEG